MKRILVAIGLFLVVSQCFAAADDDSYCDYTTEKYKAEQLLLQSPKLTLGGGRDSIGSTNAVGIGVTESLSGYLKGRLSNQIGSQDCDLFRHINAITRHVSYDLPALQVKYNEHRIDVINSGILALEHLQDEETRRVAVGGSTVIVVDLINSAIEKLRVERVNLQQQNTLTVLPDAIEGTRLDQLLAETTELEFEEQQTIARQAKYDNWDVSMSAGFGSPLVGIIPQSPIQPFILMNFSYSFGASARSRALDKSGAAAAHYNESLQNGPIHLANQLAKQIDGAKAINESALTAYRSYQDNLQKNFDDVAKVDSPDAHRFTTQLAVELAIAHIETEAARFNVAQMDTYLRANFAVE